MGKRLVDMTPADLDATFTRLFGPDPMSVRCTYCGQEPNEVCTTPSGRVTIHAARRKAVAAS